MAPPEEVPDVALPVTARRRGFVEAGGARLEFLEYAPVRTDAPSLVLLHEGLGSVALWKEFPAELARATGARVIAYSRQGYGRSTPIDGDRAVDYMHREGREVLPVVLDGLGVRDPILVGHSDGASIAVIYQGTYGADGGGARGLVLMAPHIFVEDLSVASIAEAADAFRTTDLRRRLSRYHEDVDGAFWGWNRIWLDPEFRDWNIEPFLASIDVPVLCVQGRDDEYGTLAQLEAIKAGAGGPVQTLALDDCKHSPQRDQPDLTIRALSRFVERVQEGALDVA